MSVHDCRAMQDDDWSYNLPVNRDEIVSMCLVDNDLADGQLAQLLADSQVSHMN